MTGPWIKLWRSFLSDPTIQSLIMRYGHVTVTLLVALLISAEEGVVTTPEDEIADLCKISDENYLELVQIIIQKKIISRGEDGKIRITNWAKYQHCDSLERVRNYRSRHSSEDHQGVTPPLHERYGNADVTGRSKKLEDRSKKEEREKREKTPSSGKETFGEFANVHLLPLEHSSLLADYGPDQTRAIVEKLSQYKAAKGKTYKSDMAAIRQWVIDSTGVQKIPKPEPPCPHCGKPLDQGACMNRDCPQYDREAV